MIKTKLMKINRVCIEDSAYSLLLYFLISNKEDIESTIYFVSDGIPIEVRHKLPGRVIYFSKQAFVNKNVYSQCLWLLSHRLFSKYRWRELSKYPIFGLDHTFYASPLVGNKEMTVIEDGTLNYGFPIKNEKHKKLKKLLFGPLYVSNGFGDTPICKELILTGLKETEFTRRKLPRIINIEQLWKTSSELKKTLILNIYGLGKEDVKNICSKKYILFTQCLSEDSIMSEEKKIEIYKQMISGIAPEDIVIKPHPRETTDYSKYFPKSYIFTKKVPMQLLNLIGAKFERSYTICSTAALSFPYKIDSIFLGTDSFPEIAKVYGDIRLSDYQNE